MQAHTYDIFHIIPHVAKDHAFRMNHQRNYIARSPSILSTYFYIKGTASRGLVKNIVNYQILRDDRNRDAGSSQRWLKKRSPVSGVIEFLNIRLNILKVDANISDPRYMLRCVEAVPSHVLGQPPHFEDRHCCHWL